MIRLTRSKLLLAAFISGLLAGVCSAQSTTVSATVVDSTSQAFANGTYTITFQPAPNQPSNYFWNGTPFPKSQWVYSGTLDSSGAFSVTIPDNSFITPVGSSWNFSLCSNTSAQCSNVKSIAVSGATLNLSSTFTASITPPQISALPMPRAYSDSEVPVSPTQVGYVYQNVTANLPRYWNGAIWNYFGGTVNGLTIGNLANFASVTAGGSPANPTFNWSYDTAPANQLFGNCTSSSTTNPNYCSITSAMLPTTIAANTTGNATSATTAAHLASVTDCTLPAYATGMSTSGVFTCAQPSFAQLTGNIAVTQMDSGTNADATHVWTGNGHWEPISSFFPALDYYFTFTGCSISNGSNLNSCTGTINFTTGTTPTFAAMPDANYFPFCTVNTGNTYTASFSVGGTLTTTGFVYWWTEIMSNGDTSSTPTIYCHLHHN